MPPILLEAQFQLPKWRNDFTASISLITSKEVSNEQFTHFSNYKLLAGWFMFGPNQFKLSDLPSDSAAERGSQTRAQRIKSKLYKVYLKTGSTGDFGVFYEQKMNEFEQLIDEALA